MSSEYQRQRVSTWLRRWAGRASRVAVIYDGDPVAEVLLIDGDGRRVGDNDAADALCDAAEECAASAGRAVTVSIRVLNDTAGAPALAQMPYRAIAPNAGGGDENTIKSLLAQNHAFARANLELLQQQQQGFTTLLDSMTRLMEAATRRAEAEAARADAATAQAREAVEVAEEVQAAAARKGGEGDTRAQLAATVLRLLEPRVGALIDAAAGQLLTPGETNSTPGGDA